MRYVRYLDLMQPRRIPSRIWPHLKSIIPLRGMSLRLNLRSAFPPQKRQRAREIQLGAEFTLSTITSQVRGRSKSRGWCLGRRLKNILRLVWRFWNLNRKQRHYWRVIHQIQRYQLLILGKQLRRSVVSYLEPPKNWFLIVDWLFKSRKCLKEETRPSEVVL